MMKKTFILVLILLISGVAAYSFVSIEFSDKLGMVFRESGQMQRNGQTGQKPNGSGRAGRHGAISSWDGLFQIGAYFSVFAFVVMLTYYGEQLLRKPSSSKKVCTSLQKDCCKTSS